MPVFNDLQLASVNQIAKGGHLVCCDGWSNQTALPVPSPALPHINLVDLLKINNFPKWMYQAGTFHHMTVARFRQICQKPFRFVTDSSYDQGKGMAAAIFESIDHTEHLMFVTSVPSNIDCTYSFNDAYRSEKCGILAGLTIIQL